MPENNDLEAFSQTLPDIIIDEKVARLEKEIADLKQKISQQTKEHNRQKKRANQIYFILIFLASIFFSVLVVEIASTFTSVVTIVFTLIFLMILAKWLNFSSALDYLEPWHSWALNKASKINLNKPVNFSEGFEPNPNIKTDE